MDYGRTWLTVGAMAASEMRALALDGAQLIAAAETGEIAVSSNGTTWTWVGAINQLSVVALGADTPLATAVEGDPAPPRFAVGAPRPNPRVGNGGFTCSFTCAGPVRVTLQLYGIDGRLLASRAPQWLGAAGIHEIEWKPGGLPVGTYLVRLTTDSGRFATTKWTLMR